MPSHRFDRALVALAVLPFSAACQSTPSPQTPVLPLRTVRLYETGVGYFERSGTLSGDAAVGLPVPSGHLDDALKTLVFIGQDGTPRVSGLEFASSVSKGMARALTALPLDASAPVTYFDMLASLKGAAVDIETKAGVLHGRIIDVLEPPKVDDASKDAKSSPATIVFVTNGGAIRKLSADDAVSVRPLEPAFSTRLDASLDALSTHGAHAQRTLRVITQPGPVTLGYVAEAPIWRTTYRMVIGKDATLQGWALLHNDTDEAWNGVRVSLVNGQPDSFLFPLAAPRYARRTLVTPEYQAATVPQLLGKTVDAIWGDHIDGDDASAGGLGLSGIGQGGGGRGEGIGLGAVGTVGHGAAAGHDGASSLLSVGDLASVAPAAGVEAGALFSYTLPHVLDLRARGSALVPFVHAKVAAELMTWFESPSASARAGVRLVNSTPQTLPSGPLALFEGGGFVGESAIDRLKPNERRFLRFGADLDVSLAVERSDSKESVKRVSFADGALVTHYVKTTTSDWTVINRGGKSRSVLVSLDVVRNAKVTGPDALDFDIRASRPIAIFNVAARNQVRRTVASIEGLSRATPLASLGAEGLSAVALELDLSPGDRAILADAAQKQKDVDATAKAIAKATADLAVITKDTDRLREHLKAMGDKGQAAAANPFVARILAAEDKLTSLRKRLEDLDAESKSRAALVHAVVEKLGR